MNGNNMIQALFQVMKMRGINIPSNVDIHNPDAIINYLMQNGKITQEQYNIAYQQRRNMQGNNNSR